MDYRPSYRMNDMGSVDYLSFSRMVRFFKIILQHVAEYCAQAAIHGPQHIVSERLSRFERLVTITITVIYTEKPSADFSAKTITKTAEGFFLDGVSEELVALVTIINDNA